MAAKVWMVTGASRGIGAEIAKAAVAAGDKLIATARDARAFDRFKGNDNVIAVAFDVTDEAQVVAGVREGLSRFGRIDVLVNNAGFGLLGAIEETPAESVEHIYRTNVFGLLNVIRAELPGMRRHRRFSGFGGMGRVLLDEVCRRGHHRSSTRRARTVRDSCDGGRTRILQDGLHGQSIAQQDRTPDR
jgi:NAD(P)-dependent dehydrogenase (short-subunit alcohol dehydrogenase family)